MTWRTPCLDDPELWVGTNVEDRLHAARKCLACPALTTCAVDALTNPPDFGVQAGNDYTPRSPKVPFVANCITCGLPMIGHTGKRRTCDGCVETKPCKVCQQPFERDYKSSQKQWDARVVCGRKCSRVSNQHRRAA